MKKFFTFALAAFAAMSMYAALTFTGAEFKDKTELTKDGISVKLGSEIAVSNQQIWKDGSDAKKEDAICIGSSANHEWDTKYLEISSVNELQGVSITGVVNKTDGNKYKVAVVYWKGDASANLDGFEEIELTDKAQGSAPSPVELSVLAGTKTIRIYRAIRLSEDGTAFSNASGYKQYGSGQSTYIPKIEIQNCTAPAEPLTFTASKTSEIYEGDEITFSSTGGNSGDKAITLDGNAFTADKWMAEAGEHTFVMTQDVKDGKCGATIEIKLTVATKAPVSKAEIEGSKTAIINKEVTLTCKAENATNFQWYKGSDKIDGATAAEYKFTPTEAGELSFSCEAWNKFTDPHVKSNAFTITVAESECGKLITFVVKTGSGSFDKDFTIDKDQDNVIGGTAHQKTDKNGKINKDGAYISLKLAEGSFAAGDVVTIVASNVNNCTNGYETTLYSDAGVTLIGKAPFDEAKTATIKLQGAAETIYLYRLNFAVDSMNPTVSSMSVRRPCGSESSDASIKSLSMNGNVIEAKDKLYAFEVAADYDSTNPVEIKFELNDSKAKADHDSPFKLLAPDKSSDTIRAEINVTAEDFTKAQYKIEITRAEAPKSTDASIKELKINNEVVAEKEGVFAYEVAAEAALDSVEVSFTLADKAIAEPASPFKVLVPEAGAGASEKAIKVTAEDGTTTKEYKVSVTKAKKAEEGLDNVTDGVKVVKYFENGQLVIIKNGIKYNAQGAVVK